MQGRGEGSGQTGRRNWKGTEVFAFRNECNPKPHGVGREGGRGKGRWQDSQVLAQGPAAKGRSNSTTLLLVYVRRDVKKKNITSFEERHLLKLLQKFTHVPGMLTLLYLCYTPRTEQLQPDKSLES